MLTGFWLFTQLFLSRSVHKPDLRVSSSVYFDWFLVRGIPLPVAQVFVVAIEITYLPEGCWQSNQMFTIEHTIVQNKQTKSSCFVN